MTLEPIDLIREALGTFRNLVRAASRVIIGTHLNPDGDALGSALSVSLILDQWGVPNDVVCNNLAPDSLKFLPGAERITTDPGRVDHDLAIILDLEAMDRLGSVRPLFDRVRTKIVVDHHIPYESPGDLRIVTTAYPATCSILFDLFHHKSVTMTPEIATCLLTGILTDTGNFRYPNTTPHALYQTALLLEGGGNISQISEEVYMRKNLGAVQLLGYVLANMHLSEDQRLAWAVIPIEVFVGLKGSDQDTEGIVNELLAIKTVEIAALLRESKPGKIRGSLRSRAKFDVATVAQEFGGGGHRNAAGVSFEGSLTDAEAELVRALKQCLASS